MMADMGAMKDMATPPYDVHAIARMAISAYGTDIPFPTIRRMVETIVDCVQNEISWQELEGLVLEVHRAVTTAQVTITWDEPTD